MSFAKNVVYSRDNHSLNNHKCPIIIPVFAKNVTIIDCIAKSFAERYRFQNNFILFYLTLTSARTLILAYTCSRSGLMK